MSGVDVSERPLGSSFASFDLAGVAHSPIMRGGRAMLGWLFALTCAFPGCSRLSQVEESQTCDIAIADVAEEHVESGEWGPIGDERIVTLTDSATVNWESAGGATLENATSEVSTVVINGDDTADLYVSIEAYALFGSLPAETVFSTSATVSANTRSEVLVSLQNAYSIHSLQNCYATTIVTVATARNVDGTITGRQTLEPRYLLALEDGSYRVMDHTTLETETVLGVSCPQEIDRLKTQYGVDDLLDIQSEGNIILSIQPNTYQVGTFDEVSDISNADYDGNDL